MLSNIQITCFAASYGVALALEVSRLWFRSGLRSVVLHAFAWAGYVAHSVYLYYQVLSPSGYPLSSPQGWFFCTAWVLANVYLYLLCFRSRTAFGAYLLPLILALIALGTFWADATPFPRDVSLKSFRAIHAAAFVLLTAAVFVAFPTGVMYLVQARRLKTKRIARGRLVLPSLEWLQYVNRRMLGVSLVLMSVGILSGLVLAQLDGTPAAGSGPSDVTLTDPTVLGSFIMFAYLVGVHFTAMVFPPAREGHQVAHSVIASFGLLLVVFVLGLLSGTGHWRMGHSPAVETRRGVSEEVTP